ncbi:MAG: F0F1 ATP synthase subunit beta, partial [Candidatus Aminicenantes bacterium]|nr:F0F1 ATP synthase subunit beta [Candidatus Aminicenantes bacterium]
MSEKTKKTLKYGKVVQIIGPVVDIEFKDCELPEIYNAIRVTSEGFDTPFPVDIIVEVELHIGGDKVRCVAMQPTDGLSRGMKAYDLDAPITVPVGEETLGRVINVLGEPIDYLGPINAKKYYPIHRQPPSLEEQSTDLEMFETGIKVIDLIQPFLKGGKIGL